MYPIWITCLIWTYVPRSRDFDEQYRSTLCTQSGYMPNLDMTLMCLGHVTCDKQKVVVHNVPNLDTFSRNAFSHTNQQCLRNQEILLPVQVQSNTSS